MVKIYIMGQCYQIPESLTILKAFEWAGFHLTRGVGCRGGFCGACGTVYRMQDDHKLYYALACQTVIQPGMILSQIPFFPAHRAAYHIDELQPTGETLLEKYPEILRCFGCNTCTKACPQEIDVLSYMAAAVRGDVAAVAEISFDCIACGLCVARCPAEEAPPNVALLSRRLYGKYLAPPAAHLRQRVQDIDAGAFRSELDQLKITPVDELRQLYASRQIEE